MRSALYEGTVRHRRLSGPAEGEFSQRLFMAYLDLDELPQSIEAGRLSSARRRALARFRRTDHLGDRDTPLQDAVRALVAERTGRRPHGPVGLLTHLRCFGHVFNPVSFYWCFAPDGERVEAVVAHVTNTPWGESHSYVLDADAAADHGSARVARGSFSKELHVSPLMGMDQTYELRASDPGERISVHIESRTRGGRAAVRRDPVARQARVDAARAAPPARPVPGADRRDPDADLRPRAAPARARRRLPPAPGGGAAMSAPAAVALRRRDSGPPAQPGGGRGAELSRRVVLRALRGIRGGQLELREAGHRIVVGEQDPASPLRAVIEVRSPAFYRQLLRGSVGLCESYLDGIWECDDLVAMTRIAARNVGALDSLRRALAPVLIPAQRWAGWLERNTRRRARQRIEAHYDLGNELFALFLDETMMYSCGVFEHAGATLHEASVAKLDLICRRLELRPGEEVLEIGTGWGGFACHAAEHYGARVTTTTISREQHAYATERVRAAGLEDRVTVLCEDYRSLRGSYDKLVSIEMIEAVGWQYFGRFFRCCSELLREDGAMMLQAIVIDDRAYEVEKAGRSFINTHVFPGGCLPSLEVIGRTVARVTDLHQAHLEDITDSYVRTLAAWRERFLAAEEQVAALGYDERFRRLWELYLCYCEGGFAERRIRDVQMVLAKPGFSSQLSPARL